MTHGFGESLLEVHFRPFLQPPAAVNPETETGMGFQGQPLPGNYPDILQTFLLAHLLNKVIGLFSLYLKSAWRLGKTMKYLSLTPSTRKTQFLH